MSKENHCLICGHKEHYETETSLYECSNPRCKLNGLWFSGPEWRRLCKGSQPRYGTEKVVQVAKPLAPAEVTTLEELRAAQRFNIPFVIPKPDQSEQPLEMVTLRDRYAMAALTGLTAINDYASFTTTTKTAFSIADECMKQRKAREGE